MKLRNFLLFSLTVCSLGTFAQTHTEGMEYYKAEQFGNAQELLNRNLNNASTDKALSFYYLGMIDMRRDNVSAATKYFQDGISLDPTCPYNYVGMGYVALKAGDLKGAEKYFKDAEKNAKKDQSVQVEIARAYYEADPVTYKEKYEKILANALKKDVKNPDIYIFQGDVWRDEAYDTKDPKIYGKAAAQYDMATSYDPQSAVAYVKYADMYMNAKNPSYAIIKLNELAENNPTSALGQRELANAYYESQQYDKAAQKYGEYVKNPNHFKEDEDRYALLLFFAEDYQRGYDYATDLLKQDPNNFTAQRFQFMNASFIDSMNDQLLSMAENLYTKHNQDKKANQFAPIDYTLIANALGSNGRADEAIALLNEAIAGDPSNANFEKNLANAYIQNEDYAGAANAYNNYLSKTVKPSYNDLIRATVYAYNAAVKNNNDATYFDMALQNANKARETDDAQYQPYKLMGDIALTQASPEKAGTAAFDYYFSAAQRLEGKADKYASDARTVYKYLGAYYAEKKDIANAKMYLSKYLELNPNDETVRKVYNSL